MLPSHMQVHKVVTVHLPHYRHLVGQIPGHQGRELSQEMHGMQENSVTDGTTRTFPSNGSQGDYNNQVEQMSHLNCNQGIWILKRLLRKFIRFSNFVIGLSRLLIIQSTRFVSTIGCDDIDSGIEPACPKD